MTEQKWRSVSLWLVIAAIIIFAVSLVNSISMIGKPFPGFLIKHENIVQQNTFWYWTGYSANLRYLDVVLKVNGQDVGNSGAVYKILDTLKEGDIVKYLIQRFDGRVEEVAIPVMIFSGVEYFLTYSLYFLVAIGFLGIATYTYYKRPAIQMSYIFQLLSFVFAVWLLTVLHGRMMFGGWLFSMVSWLAQFALGATIIHFGLMFLQDIKYFDERKNLQVIPYVVALPALVVFLFASLAPGSARLLSQSAAFSVLYIAAGLVFMYSAFSYVRYNGSDSVTRQKARLLLLAVFFGSLSGLAGVAFTLLNVQLSLSVVLLPVLFMPVVFSYAIINYDPFEVDSIIRKIINTIAIIGVVIVAYNFFVKLSVPMGYEMYRSPVFSILFILFFLFAYDGLDFLFGKLVTRFVFGVKFDYQKMVAKITDQIATMMNSPKIIATVKKDLIPALKVLHLEILLIPYNDPDHYVSQDGKTVISLKEGLFKMIKEREGGPVTLYEFLEDPQHSDISEKYIARMNELKAIVIVPVMFREIMTGLMILGERERGALYYSTDELVFLKNLGFQVAVAIENAKLFEHLDRSKKVIEDMHTSLELKVAERTEQVKEKNAELDVLNDRLRDITARKTDFLANMSHELRTPLNAVMGYAALLKQGVYGELSQEVIGAITEMENSGNHLLGLINDVLDLSKVESGKIELEMKYFEVQEVTDLVEFSTRPLLSGKGLYLKIERAPDLPNGYGDVKRINQVLINLIGNSAKFTHEGGITVRVNKEDKYLRFEAEDTGIGVAKDKLPDMFKEFKQVHVGEYGGTGLGLTISKKIVELHGGKIWVDSEINKGTKFTFLIPTFKVEKVVLPQE